MKLKTVGIGVFSALLASVPAGAQVVADLVAASGIPAGNLLALHTPAGMVIIGNNVWVGDEVQGLRHYLPVDAANLDPINTGQFQFDINTEWSMGGGTAWSDRAGRQHPIVRGVLRPHQRPCRVSQVASFAGITGDLPTSTVLGPDGKLYVGFLKNGNITRSGQSSGNQFDVREPVLGNCRRVAGRRPILYGVLGGRPLHRHRSGALGPCGNNRCRDHRSRWQGVFP